MAQNTRGNLVSLILALVLGVLFIISYQTISYVLAAVFGMAFVGYLHYALWGYALSQDVSKERAEFLREQQRELDQHAPIDPYGIQVRRSYPPPPDDRIQR